MIILFIDGLFLIYMKKLSHDKEGNGIINMKWLKGLKDFRYGLLSICTIPLLNSVYLILNGKARVVYNLTSSLDQRIPFVKAFILPYSMWYPFIITSLLYLFYKDRKVFYKTIISIDLGLICCYVIYILFQTTVPRPILYGNDIFTKLVQLTYFLDEPFNCLPSIHVLTSFLVMNAYYKSKMDKTLVKYLVFFMGGTIIVSTLFVKQHIIVDLIAAVMLGLVLNYLTSFINEENVGLYIKKQFSSWMMKKKLET